jgi:hypothetical protein
VRQNYRRRRSRAHGASADELFEQALLGVENNEEHRKFDPREDRKTLQLCRQVQRSLSMALAGECGDEILRDVYVESVEPMGGAGHLLVRIVIPPSIEEAPLELIARLSERTAQLRATIARDICRKRVPNLRFIAVPPNHPKEVDHG